MTALTCPRCAFVAEFASGQQVVCPACGYPGPDLRQWAAGPAVPPSSGGKVVAIVLGVVCGVILLTVVLSAVVFVLVTKLSDSSVGPEAFHVVSARMDDASACAAANGTCHILTVMVDNRNATSDFYVTCCWTAIDTQGGGHESMPTGGEPQFVVAGAQRQVTLRFLVDEPGERLVTLRYDFGGEAGSTSRPVPAY